MTNLTRWDPFREMALMRNWMDRIVEELGSGSRSWSEGANSGSMALDIAEDNDSYIVYASIPGIDPEDLEITLQNDVLTIRGETHHGSEQKNERYHLRERQSGSFLRSIMLPSAVDRERVEASCEHGVLTLRLPKSEEQKPRRIAINATNTIAGRPTSQVGEVSSEGSGQSNSGSTQGQDSGSTDWSGHAEAGAGTGNGQTQPRTDEQSSSTQSMEGLEGLER
jgi:HSP20 family protein